MRLTVPSGWCRHRAPGSGHDITGSDITLNFLDAQRSCRTGLRSSNVAADRRPTEKQAPAGELADFTALGTHEACQCRGPGPAMLWNCRLGRYTGSTCHECHSGKRACRRTKSLHIVPPTWYKPVCTRCPFIYTVLYTYGPVPSRTSPWLHQNEIKSIIAAEARATHCEKQ